MDKQSVQETDIIGKSDHWHYFFLDTVELYISAPLKGKEKLRFIIASMLF